MENKREPVDWITVKGNHVPIFEGQTPEEAINQFIGDSYEKETDESDDYEKVIQSAKVPFTRTSKEYSDAEKLQRVNPDRQEHLSMRNKLNATDEEKDAANNCQKCVVCYVLQRLGYDVKAKPGNPVKQKLKMFNQMFKDSKVSEISGIDAYMALEDNWWDNAKRQTWIKHKFEDEVKKAGNGALYIVRIDCWSNDDHGHVFIAENVNGRVKYYDPQTNESKGQGENFYKMKVDVKDNRDYDYGMGYLRVDNNELIDDEESWKGYAEEYD